MAIDKKRTSAGTKAVIIVVIIAFVLLSIAGVVSSLTTGGSGSASNPQSTNTAALAAISAQVKPAIDAQEQQLKTKPKDYALLKSLGDAYFDWALKVQQAAQGAGLDTSIWFRAADYYKRALAVKSGDPSVETDMSIATFYSGDTAGAIAIVERVMKASPKFAQAFYNAGVFYQAAGQNAKAVVAYQRSVQLDPKAASVAQAQQQITALRGSASATGTTGSAPATGQ
jgi:tetratricopeptide (TPR) repeat protein